MRLRSSWVRWWCGWQGVALLALAVASSGWAQGSGDAPSAGGLGTPPPAATPLTTGPAAQPVTPGEKSSARPVLSSAQVPLPSLSSAAWTGPPPWRTPDAPSSAGSPAIGSPSAYGATYGAGAGPFGVGGTMPPFRAPSSGGGVPAALPSSFAPPLNPYVSTGASTPSVPVQIAPGLATAPVAQKPFSDYRLPPAISPYMNLYRFNPLTGVDNYNLFVRPILEQEAFNRQTAAQLRSLRAATQAALAGPQSAQPGLPSGAIWQGQPLQPSGATFMNLQPYYPAFSAGGRR